MWLLVCCSWNFSYLGGFIMRVKTFGRARNSVIISIVLHIIIGIIMGYFIETEYKPKEEFIEVEWVPAPPVKIKPHRSMPKGLPKIEKVSEQKTASKPSSKTVKRSAHEIPEVIEQGPELVRESVEIDRDTKISTVLPVVATTAKFDTQTQTHKTISESRATHKMIKTSGAPMKLAQAGRKSDRVRAAGAGNYQGLADTDIFGKGRQSVGTGIGTGIGDEFADVGTKAPKYVDIGKLKKEAPEDIFGIGEYVDKGRNGRKNQDVVYLLDLSSSMKGKKVKLAKEALKDALAMLREDDRFNILVFNNRARLYSDKILPVTQSTLKQAHNYLDRVKIHRGTNLSEALKKSLKLNASTIVVISDGHPTRGITKAKKLLNMVRRLNKSQARIMSIGIGRGHSTESIKLLTKLVKQNNGEIRLIDL